MSASRRDVVRVSALAASALAVPALADTRPLEPMRLLILGGTGFIGPHQVRYALARGHHITIFNRGRRKEAWPGSVEELIGDRDGDLKALESGDWDVCIDNPTSLPAWVRDAASVLESLYLAMCPSASEIAARSPRMRAARDGVATAPGLSRQRASGQCDVGTVRAAGQPATFASLR